MSTESATVVKTDDLLSGFFAGLFIGLVTYVVFLSYVMSDRVADPSSCAAAIDYVEKTDLGDVSNLNANITLYAGLCRAFSPDSSIRMQSRAGRHASRLALAFVLSLPWLILIGALTGFLVSRIAKGQGIMYRLASQFEADHLQIGFFSLGFLCTTLNLLTHEAFFGFIGHLFSLKWL